MPASSRERLRRAAALTALSVVVSGCVTGHLLAAARRREYAREIRAVTRETASTRVDFVAEVTDDAGRSRGMVERTVRLPPGASDPTLRELTRLRTEAWVYPLLPLALAADVVVVPTLVLMSPSVLVIGD